MTQQQETGMDAAQTPDDAPATDRQAVDGGGEPTPVEDNDIDEQICDDQLVDGLVEDQTPANEADDEPSLDDDSPTDGADDSDGMEDGTDSEEDDEDDEPDGEIMSDMDSVIEAILFASDEPLTPARLVSVLEAGSVKQVRRSVKELNKKYARSNCAFRIEEIAGGYQMMTLPAYNPWLRKLLRVRTDNKLTQAALETLAIIAYKQPLIRADIEAIRGVASGEVIRNLMYKGLVKIVGRAEVIGRPMLYGTTRRFLDIFGLSSLKDLPKVEELKKPD
ncbi:MAG: SMC-Scp complex subunit ScpB [Phycisphaerae bacterium]|nr:SMC-Scp complex subunit ScpB [Phycisphaerae bacterium]